jgi:AcrR family transcriptional regulator
MPTEKISARDAILQATIAELTVSGAETFTPLTVCKQLGIKPNLVNYHFKSREGLIREAAVTSYEEYGRGLCESVGAVWPCTARALCRCDQISNRVDGLTWFDHAPRYERQGR